MSRNSSRVPLDFWLRISICALGSWLGCASCAAAQQLTIPENPSVSEPSAHSAMPVIVEPATRPEAPVHLFWDRTNMFLFSGVSIFRGLDYASTRNMQARGREERLSYWMHRAGHHKLERWVSIAHISVTGFGAARNYALKSKHPPGAR